jgi:hypothetical protein
MLLRWLPLALLSTLLQLPSLQLRSLAADVQWSLTLSGQDVGSNPQTFRDDVTQWSSLFSGTSTSIRMPVETSDPGVKSLSVLAEWTFKGYVSAPGTQSGGNDGALRTPSNSAQPTGRHGQAYWSGADGNFYIYGTITSHGSRSEASVEHLR